MTFTTNKIDEANATITGTITKDVIDTNLNKVAAQAAKTMDIQGFRKGKVPVAIVKQRFAEKLTQDAESDALRQILDDAIVELKIDRSALIGEPAITKFDKKEDGNIDVEINISCKPTITLGDYKALVPNMTNPVVEDKEIKEQLKQMASQGVELTKIKRKRAVKSGDFALIDFEGFKDGVAFDGGKADNHSLEIGSNSFIPGFEDQVIGMIYNEQKDITVTFPEEYQSKDLAGADVVFKVKLHEIQEKVAQELDDEFAKKMLPQDENATMELLNDKLKEQLLNQKKNQYFTEEIKPKYTEILVNEIKFALPTAVLDQEINQVINEKVRTMSEDEIKTLQENPEEIKKLQDEVKPEAINSVKATFIVDALAKEEAVEITDEEVTQTIYYEAMMNGKDGTAMIKEYEEAGYLPMIKMSMIESKVMIKILDEALSTKKESK